MSRRVVMIANPVAGSASRRKVRKAVELLGKGGLDVELAFTEKGGDAERLARAAAEKSPRMVVASGGDGTFNEVANGLAGTGVPMALLPMGTSNVLAKELGVPESPEGAVAAALNGSAHSVFLGKITLGSGSRYFCLMAGMGFDGEIVHDVRKRVSHPGKLAHIVQGLRTIVTWRPEALSIEVDGRPYEGYSLIVCKASKYAGHFRVAPDADMKEPAFGVFIMHGRRRRDFLRYVLGILAGRHTGLRDITYIKGRDVEVSGAAHVQADGDYLGTTPASVTVAPEELRVIY